MIFSGRNLWLKKRYLVFGAGYDFHHILSPRKGFKHRIDALTLRYLRFPSLRRNWVLDRVQDGFSRSVSAFLFFDTSDYKDTHFIGVVAFRNGDRCFTKIYKDESDAVENREKAHLAQQYFSDSFVVAKPIPSTGCIAALTLLDKKSNAEIDQVWSVVRNHSVKLYKQAHKIKEWGTILSWYSGVTTTKLVVGHGDLSHWNCFWNDSGALCLIDYEEIDYYAPMYDCFHLLLKPTLLNTTAELPMAQCIELAEHSGESLDRVLLWLYVYLETENSKDRARNVLLRNKAIDRAIDNRLDLQKKCKIKLLSRKERD